LPTEAGLEVALERERAEAERVLRLTTPPQTRSPGASITDEQVSWCGWISTVARRGPPVPGIDVLGLDGVAVEGHALEVIIGGPRRASYGASDSLRQNSRKHKKIKMKILAQ